MKIKYVIIAATILAAATVTTVKTLKEETSWFNANVEALARSEVKDGALWYNGTIMCCGPGNVRDCSAVDENGKPIYVACNF